MRIYLGDIECSGFAAFETDFAALYASTSFGKESDLTLDTMVEAAVTAESNLLGMAFCDITIVGHSDRVDDEGVSAEDRRAAELDASYQRATTARDWMFGEIVTRLSNQGFSPPPDIPGLQFVTIRIIPCGAADLVNTNPGSDEDLRRANRRVRFIGASYLSGP